MGLIIVLVAVALLGVPFMLIVSLVKLSGIEDQLSSLDKKIETADIAKKIKAVPKPTVPIKDNAEEPEMKNRIESQKGDFVEMKVAKPPEPVKPVEPLNHPTTQPPNHPTTQPPNYLTTPIPNLQLLLKLRFPEAYALCSS